MKRLIGVMIVAAVPVACGVQTATTPDNALPVGQESGFVAALKVPVQPPTCVPGERPQIQSIKLVVVSQGKRTATVRAVIDLASSEMNPPVCLYPTWKVSPAARLDPITEQDLVVVQGAPGRYKVSAVSTVTGVTRLYAETAVTIQ